MKKYRNPLNKLTQYAESAKVKKPLIDAWEVVDLDAFRADRGLAKITSSKELELLRQFWEFSTVRGWCPKNIARLIKAPQITDQNEVVPYTKLEQVAILKACDTFGRNNYERGRARALILSLRNAIAYGSGVHNEPTKRDCEEQHGCSSFTLEWAASTSPRRRTDTGRNLSAWV